MQPVINRRIEVPEGAGMSVADYEDFLRYAYGLMKQHPQYLAPDEDINDLELAHLFPAVDETLIAIYVAINDAVCNKGLVVKILPNHAHNNVFAFDPEVFPGGADVPAGTVDMKETLTGFEPPNDTWNPDWTYVVIRDPDRTFESLWQEQGYIDTIPAKFEDFTMLSDPSQSKVCTFINPKAFDHPVNRARAYLGEARRRGETHAGEFTFPDAIADEWEGLCPVMLNRGEKLYVANPDFSPCDHCWSNIHPDNADLAVVNENSAVPLDLVTRKPPVPARYAAHLRPAAGSADLTTDCFRRGKQIHRLPLLQGTVQG